MNIRQHRKDLVRRVAGLHGVAQLGLMVIAVTYFYVQVAEGGHYRSLADNNRIRRLSIEAPRGLIRDRHGTPLAENVPSYSLFIDRSRVDDLDRSVDFAASVLGVPSGDLSTLLDSYRSVPAFQPVRLAERLSLAEVTHFGVENLEFPEFEIVVEHQRLYRHAHRTAHLLGYLGEVSQEDLEEPDRDYRPGDLVGKKGIEGRYEDVLRGDRGEQIVVVDHRGRLVEELERVPAKKGRDLVLTLDLDLQQAAARELEGKVGAVVALDPRDGEVRALVSTPAFDPNRFARRLKPDEWRQMLQNPNHPLQNRTLQNTYPPGSVFKIVMALAGLEEGLIDPQKTSAYCPGYSKIYGNRYRCWRAGGHGRIHLRGSLKHSCNVFYHQLGQKIDIDTIARWAGRFGLGEPTGIDLDGERQGLIPSSGWSLEARGSRWFPGETISVATGQGPILVTPIQIARLMAAVANGGVLVRPQLVRGTGTAPAPRTLGIDPQNLDLVREALWSVVNEEEGTGRAAALAGHAVAGKTGTAQVVTQEVRTHNEELPPELRDHAWFASFAPFEDPRLVVVVFVEHGGAGSRAAAPIAKTIYKEFFDRELPDADLAYLRPAG